MNKEFALDLIKLLSALESWGFLEGKRLPDYLFDQISDRVCELSKIVLEGGMSRELLKRCKDFMDYIDLPRPEKLYADLETYLAQPEPEPVAWVNGDELDSFKVYAQRFTSCRNKPNGYCKTPLYTSPPDQSARIAELEKSESFLKDAIEASIRDTKYYRDESESRLEGLMSATKANKVSLDKIAELEALNADLLRQLSNYHIDWESQEDLLEQLYWEFDADRKKHPENERIRFKGKLRFFAGQVNQYAATLTDAYKRKSDSYEQQLAALQARKPESLKHLKDDC